MQCEDQGKPATKTDVPGLVVIKVHCQKTAGTATDNGNTDQNPLRDPKRLFFCSALI